MKSVIINKNRGFLDVTLLLIIIVVILGVLLTTGLKNKSPQGTDTLIPEASSSSASLERKNLQLETLKFSKKPQTFDCGPGTTPSREGIILWAMEPDPGGSVGPGGAIKLFYSDELPLTLGQGNVSPQNSERHIVKPNVSIGDPSAKDPNGLPVFPALFLTDTTSDPNSTTGDAEKGGTPIPPDEVWGSWQPFGNISQDLVIGQGRLPAGADPFPQESNVSFSQDSRLHGVPHGTEQAEIIWHVDNLSLTTGHTYRAQFIIHDGDQAGDLAEGCATISF